MVTLCHSAKHERAHGATRRFASRGLTPKSLDFRDIRDTLFCEKTCCRP